VSILQRILGRAQKVERSPQTNAVVSPTSQPKVEPHTTLQRSANALNNYIVVVLDSCRFDTFLEAAPTILTRLGAVERRWSYASWTAPSHFNLLMGLLPHSSPMHVYASEYYKRDFLKYNERLGTENFEFKNLVPQLFLPTVLKHKLGYATHAMVSLPVLNPATLLNKDFDSFLLMPKHNDMAAMLDRMTFSTDRPSFYLLNVGKRTILCVAGRPENTWPKIHGVHGVFKHMDDRGGENWWTTKSPTSSFRPENSSTPGPSG
jgi:hypothetical protein